MQYNPMAPVGSPSDIQAAIKAGDWNTARRWLQKVAYSMVGPSVGQADKDAFRRLMTDFAARDPAYRATMQLVRPRVQGAPGLMQSDLTRGLDEQQKEALRYVLYFAAELGELVRVKKGNSYKLFLPGQTIPD